MSLETFSKREKKIARQAFDKARFREYEAIWKEVRARAVKADDPGELWDLHDYLTKKRKEMAQKYDYRYSVLIFVFAQLLRNISEHRIHRRRHWHEPTRTSTCFR